MIELIVVMAIFSLMAMLAVPRVANFIGNERKDSGLLSAYVTAASDDAFGHGRTVYLCISLNRPAVKKNPLMTDIATGTNSVSSFILEDMKLAPNQAAILKPRSFSSKFIIQGVSINGSDPVTEGDVLVPFYCDGSSESYIIEILFAGKTIHLIKDRNSRNLRSGDEK